MALIREYGIEEWHNYWASTSLEVRRELIAEALLGQIEGGR